MSTRRVSDIDEIAFQYRLDKVHIDEKHKSCRPDRYLSFTILTPMWPPPASHSCPDFVINENRGGCHGSNSVPETLGCDSGAMCFHYETMDCETVTKTRSLPRRMSGANAREYPPPITTLRGQGRLRLLKKREKGKLLMFPFKPSLIEAERSGGRLVLRFLPSGAVTEPEAGEEKEEEESPENEGDGGLRFFGSGKNCARERNCINGDAFWVASS
ncbi:hypothetical protein KSP40_PGU002998 [Platanthera guangdongensis]|uniref:FAF domain-containing protein n=1 Tax=Platanthera guangdongensis TaxID=2320717 RepID=A0ABR2MJE5_9ASPA